jgi:hypothetical protein
MVARELGVHLAQEDAVAAGLEDAQQCLRGQRRLDERAHVRAKAAQRGSGLQYVGVTVRQRLVPEDHVADEAVFFLHREQAGEVAFGQVDLAEAHQHEDVEARVPEPLERIGALRGRDVAVVAPQQARIALTGVASQELQQIVPELFLLLDRPGDLCACDCHSCPVGVADSSGSDACEPDQAIPPGGEQPQAPPAACSCIGGHLTLPKEQNTQQSPGSGRNTAWQLSHS